MLPDAWLNLPYGPETGAEGGTASRCAAPVRAVRVAGGTLPPGLRISRWGRVEGTPTDIGVYPFTLEVSDGCSRRIEERQIRVVPAPILTAEAETLEFQSIFGAPAFSGGLVRVSGSAPGRAYSVEILDGTWLQAAMRDGMLPREGSAFDADTLRLTIDPGRLPAGTHTARLRVSTWQGANAPELLFRLRVESVQALLVPAAPALIPKPLPEVEAPSYRVILPPEIPRATPTVQSKPKSRPVEAGKVMAPPRSRVLPFPRVVLPPSRTKPSAMPPSR